MSAISESASVYKYKYISEITLSSVRKLRTRSVFGEREGVVDPHAIRAMYGEKNVSERC